jgi:hypothetical protein
LRQLWLEATRAIRNAGEVAGMECRRLQKCQHTIIHRWPRQLHQVIHQRVTATAIRMQEAARQIKPDAESS